MARVIRKFGTALAAALAVAVVGVVPSANAVQARTTPPAPKVVIMTRNLYLGSSLVPALTATDTLSFLSAVSRIYATARFTNFPVRARAIAAEIATNRPDLVGLQEVEQWVTSGPGAPRTQDFLALLQAALAARGLNYTVAAVSNNADIGPIPLLRPCEARTIGGCLVTMKDRDVILVNANRKDLTWGNAQNGQYVAQQSFTPPVQGAPPVSFKRGWTSIDGTLAGVPFHYANTHLETEDFPAVQQAQAAEFLAGPAFGPGVDLVTGDFNSAANGSTTTSYSQLTAPTALRDSWSVNGTNPGLSCCENETLTNLRPMLHSRIDLILSTAGATSEAAWLVGARPFAPIPPLYASDHAGVVARLRLSS